VTDSYQLRIPDDNWERMSAWPLPAEVRRAVERRLRDQLAADPVAHLIRSIAPWGEPLNLFAFNVPDPVRPTLLHLFQFHVVYAEDEKSLIVVDVGHQTRDSAPPDAGPNLPAV
jgi:hypothetical protein